MAGGYANRRDCLRALGEIRAAIAEVVWPPGSDRFTLRPEPHVNGVVPIKRAFIEALHDRGWEPEMPFPVETGIPGSKFGAMDAGKVFGDGGPFLVEWETGNISSSHRALNKMGVGLVAGRLAGAVLVVPTATMYPYLTDRIGNVRELLPYLPVWRSLRVERGYMGILAVEHNGVSADVEPIRKGTDGRALR